MTLALFEQINILFKKYVSAWNLPDQGHVLMLNESRTYKVSSFKIFYGPFSSNKYGTLIHTYAGHR